METGIEIMIMITITIMDYEQKQGGNQFSRDKMEAEIENGGVQVALCRKSVHRGVQCGIFFFFC